MKTPKICPYCLKQFEATSNAVKFCSPTCKEQYKILSKKKRCVCSWCNKTFFTMRKKTYCSEDCRLYANARKSEKTVEYHFKPRLSLAEVARLATECGMTYGKYVEKFGI